MQRVDVWFLLLAATCLVVGVSLGIGMGIAHEFGLAPVHAHLNLLGWTSCAVFGIAYRAWPELSRGWLPRAHLLLAAPSAVLFPAGIYVSIMHEQPALAIVAALLWQAGAVLFLANVARLALGGEATRHDALHVPAE